MEQIVNEIQLLDVYFKSIKFNQLRTGQPGQIKLQVKNNFEFAKSNDNKNLRTTIITTINDEDSRMSLEIQSVGVFKISEEANYDDPKYAQIMVNTIWPFVRSQVSLVTTQPGITPILLPIMNPKVELKKENTIFA